MSSVLALEAVEFPDKIVLDLVRYINEGIFEERPWSGFLAALRQLADSGYANIIFRRPGSADEGLTEWADADDKDDPAAIKQHYFNAFAGHDPFPYFRMKAGRAVRMPELMGRSDFRHDPYFTGFLKPNGLEHMLLMRVAEPGGHQAWLTLTRPRSGREFPEAIAQLCEKLAPHLALALRSYGELEGARITQAVRDRAMRAIHQGCVSIDERRLVVRGDRHLLSGRNALPLGLDTAGKLRMTSPEADRTLGQLLAQILADTTAGVATPPAPITVNRASGQHVLVVPLTTEIARASTAIASLYFQLPEDPSRFGPSFQRLLREIYGLGEREGALAACLLRGESLQDSADIVGLTQESARTYSKRLFAKTGAGGQSDLVRILQRSVATLEQ